MNWRETNADNEILNLIVVMVAQVVNILKPLVVHLKWGNCMVCELYLNQVVLKTVNTGN